MTAREQKGLMWAVVAAGISGIAVFINSLAVKGIDPIVHTTIKNGVAGVMVLGAILATGDWRRVKRITARQWGLLLGIAVVGGSLAFALFFTGLKMIGATQGALIQKTLVVWIALMAVPLLKEKLTWKMSLGIIALYISSLVMGVNGFKGPNVGQVMVLAATILWAIENILAKMTLKGVPVNIVVAARMGLGSIILLGMVMAQNKLPLIEKLTGSQWLMLTVLGGILFGYVMSWYRALKILPATVTASVLVGATVVTSALDAVFISHKVTGMSVMQSGLIVSGIYVVLKALKAGIKQGDRKIVYVGS